MSTVERPPATADDWPLEHAAELVIRAGVASPKMLHRKLRLALAKVFELLAALETAGVVGPADASGDRRVLVAPDDLDGTLRRIRGAEQLVADTEALDEAHGGDVVLRGGLGTDEVHVDGPGAEVAVRDEGTVAEVVDAELVHKPKPPRPDPVTLIGTVVSRPAKAAVALRRSPKARRAARTLVATPTRVGVRATYTVGQGGVSWAARAVDAATFGTYRRAIRAAEAAHDREAEEKWVAALEKAKDGRTRRLKEKAGIVLSLLGLAVTLTVAAFALVTVGGVLSWAFTGGYTWSSWWEAVFAVLDTAGAVIRWTVWLVAVSVVPLAVVLAHREGKRAGRAPRWLVTRDEQLEMDSVIDERMVSLALSKLRIPELTIFFKEGGFLEFLVIPRVDGEGTYTQVKLCPGVTAEMVVTKRDVLAGNLHRAPLECWPTQGDAANILDLWVADKGVLNAGAGPWPLLDGGTVDTFEGVPCGKSQRGDVILAPLFEMSYLIGGRPGQGKSAFLRTLLLGAALDPTAELWVHVMGESPDFDPFAPRLSRYAKGLDESVYEQALQALRDAVAEMERRGKVLAAQPGGPPKTSRALANKPGLGLHLLFVALDEVHELFQHKEHGKEAAELAVRLIKRGRKYGIILLLATQSPTKDSLPRDVTRNIACGVAFSVQDHVANDGLLGSGKFKAGIRATDLRMKVDRGTCVTVGLTDNPFELIRSFYVPLEDGVDEVTPVIARAMQNIKELRCTGEPAAIETAEQDLLREVWEVLETPREQLRDILPRLRQRNPERFRPWKQATLIEALERDYRVPVGTLDGYRVVLAADVEAAMERCAAELSGADDDDL